MLHSVMANPLPDNLNLILLRLLKEDELSQMYSHVLQLERRLRALPERPMRRAVLVEQVRTFEASELVVFLSILQDRNFNGQGRARIILQELALEPHVFEDLPYERIQAALVKIRPAAKV